MYVPQRKSGSRLSKVLTVNPLWEKGKIGLEKSIVKNLTVMVSFCYKKANV